VKIKISILKLNEKINENLQIIDKKEIQKIGE